MSSFPRARIHRTSCGDGGGGRENAAPRTSKLPHVFSAAETPLAVGSADAAQEKPPARRCASRHFGGSVSGAKIAAGGPEKRAPPRTSAAERLWMRPLEGRQPFLFFGETAGYASPTFRGALSAAPKNRKTHRDLQSIFANPMNSWRVLGRKCSETVMVTAPFCGESAPWRLKKLIAGVPTEGTGSSRANERDRGKNRT